MRVLLTGASGFVGSHAVAALLAAGHRPRLLVRDPGRATKVLGDVGVSAEAVEMVPGDMRDQAAVARALDGCDAAVHSAAALGVTGPRTDLVEVNVTGTRNVVGGAVARGLDPVIHVSTIAVFVPPAGPVIRPDDPLAEPRTDYGRSKVQAERYVRGLQDDGAPVTIVYPGGVVGPAQPSLDAMMEGLAGALTKIWPMPRGGVSLIDVRDLAEALTRCLVPGRGARRLTLGGHYLTWPELADLCDELTGVPCRRVSVPGWGMIALGSLLDAVKRIRRFDYPLTRDAAEFMVTLVPADDRATLDSLGLMLRPVEHTVADALRWMAAAGHLAPAKAGRLAPADAADRTSDKEPHMLLSRLKAPVSWVSGTALFGRLAPRFIPRLDRMLNRVSGGRFFTARLVVPGLVLTTTGHRSGRPREVPLACLPEPGGSFVVVGSNFGRETHPAWTTNLLHAPSAEVSYEGRRIPVTARLLEGAEREEMWPWLLELWPAYAAYVGRANRELRVFRLIPRS